MEWICEALLYHVFHPVTLIISLDRMGKVIRLRAVDTCFGAEALAVDEDAARILVALNHPDGCMELHEREIDNLKRIRQLAGRRPVSVYICGEDVGVFEVDSDSIPGYNGEND